MIRNKNHLATARGEKIYQEHNLSLPVNLTQLAQKCEIKLEAKECASGVSGMLIRYNNDFTIVYSTHINNIGFQRFSIAHELGHYFCLGHTDALFNNENHIHHSNAGTGSGNQFEQEADAFAAGLLMPTKACRPLIRKNDDGLKTITAISEACKTSINAAAIRYIRLSAIPCAIIVSTELTIDYCICNEELMKIKGYTHPQKGSSLLKNSLISLREYNNDLGNKSEASSMDWFNTDADFDMEEEIINLGYETKNKWLTVLTVFNEN